MSTTQRSNRRAPGVRNFSVALPESVITAVQAIADAEVRTRNRQIEKFLREAVDLWRQRVGEVEWQRATRSASEATAKLDTQNPPPPSGGTIINPASNLGQQNNNNYGITILRPDEPKPEQKKEELKPHE